MPVQISCLNPASCGAKILKAMVQFDPTFVPFFGSMMVGPGAIKAPADTARYTFGPLVVHTDSPNEGGPAGDIDWLTRNTIDKWRPRVTIERVEILCSERPDLVSPTEIWMVMHNAVMAAPLYHHITEIYLWACHRSRVASGLVPDTQLLRLTEQMDIPSDDEVFGENTSLHQEYWMLAGAIRRKVIRHSMVKARQPMTRWHVIIAA